MPFMRFLSKTWHTVIVLQAMVLEICGRCGGSGVVQGRICSNCGGTGARRP